ncbi:extracellular solute-binding protein [Metapseudomonas resinovorans]|uniref:Putrescine-binding periplasmic protein n=1 Tax=Metapseudomonas resinovorans NBRC 106553 TaxID=1245471 RepID=S6AW00_METRE|nr:extracellular solute-binding protein [Pseudomonas resinovorans]BAN50463.1 polyamine ABC transporter substrate-binding protein SpuE [Pseudomonas resinovorans NBRC 106553]
MKYRRLNLLLAGALLSACAGVALASNELNIVNWSGYVSPDALKSFQEANGVKVKYDVLDSDDSLQAKLFGGNTGYDVVYPSSTFMAKQIEAGVYEKIDWSKIPNRTNLDPELMNKLALQDPGNQYGVPYVWGTDGLIVNLTKVRKILGPDFKLDDWNLIFDPAVASKLSACGISMMDSASDIFPILLAHMGRDPNSKDVDDYLAAYAELQKVRPYITQFSTSYLNDVVSGDICVAAGWSGDATVIQQRMAEAKLPDEIIYITPKGATGLWFTLMGIPKDAPNKDNAYKWINHLLSKEMAASTTNHITYTTAVLIAKPLVDPTLQASNTVFPRDEDIASAFTFMPIEPKVQKVMNKYWLRFKSNG